MQNTPSPLKIDDLPLSKDANGKHLEEVQTIFNALARR